MRVNRLAAVFSVAVVIVCSLCAGQDKSGQDNEVGTITGVHFTSFPKTNTDGSVTFTLSIEGKNLPPNPAAVRNVIFETKDPAEPITGLELVSSDSNEVLVKATAMAKTEITRIKVIAENPKNSAETRDFSVAIAENPPKPKLNQIEIKLEDEKNKDLPNVHSLVLTKVGGEGEFADDPYQMTVDLMPSGASDISIFQTNPQQLDVHFVAPSDYEPKSAVITVYNGTDLRTRKAVAIAMTKKTPEDPDKPKVSDVQTVFINRSHGVGRIRFFGEGFGTSYAPPPYPVDDYLWNCLEEFHIRGTNKDDLKVTKDETDDLDERIKACKEMVKDGSDLNSITAEEARQRLMYTKSNLATILNPNNKWEAWSTKVRDAVTVSLRSRNSDIQVERVEILEINDKMIDVYFEFTRARGFSMPMRLDSSSITIRKNAQKVAQTVKNDKLTGTVTGKEQIYLVAYDIEPKRDSNLTYKYTILDKSSANRLLGKGVADNYYVIQLSVINNGEKKVAVPLAGIQAEIEWRRGVSTPKGQGVGNKKVEQPNAFLEGPPTLAPIPLASVSSSFEAYQKALGFRAHLFNAMDALTTIATALVPVTGPAMKDAEVFFSGGFVPGVKKAWGDLSSQQLQNLTALSWESSETLPAKGGSMERLIYIEKKSPQLEASGLAATAKLEIAAILGLEVTGYEVTDTKAKAATPADKASEKPKTQAESEKKPATSEASSPAPKE